MKKKICVITSSRAEYGLLMPLIKELSADLAFDLQLIVTGMHLSPEFGLTYRIIEQDGFKINEKIESLLSSDTPIGIAKSMGLTVIGFAEVYQKLRPHIVVFLGDRFEIFSAAAAAYISRIPIVHLYGGELTEGAFDDAFRHSITKMSCLHFVSTYEYKKRVIQLGENPDSVFQVGAIGLDNIKRLKLLAKKELEQELGFTFFNRNLLITFHPVTLEDGTAGIQFRYLLSVLDELIDTKLIFTKANADVYGRVINELIDEYVKNNPFRAVSFTSIGQLKYLSIMQYVDAVVGNSSSGIIEAPNFKIGTINIGDRQKGRIRAESIIDCQPSKEEIRKALRKLYSAKFQRILKNVVNPYGDGKTTKRIVQILRNFKMRENLKKEFHDIEFNI